MAKGGSGRISLALTPFSVAIVALTAAVLYLMNRPPICTCGRIDLWVGSASSPRTSQMLADWYSLSHIVHGFLFYGALWLLLRRWSPEHRFALAVSVESFWELVENSPLVIHRYRSVTAAIGYTGDSIVNSVSDIVMMAVGFFLARRLPLWASIAAVVALELVPLYEIRDNLSLNILMLLHPSAAIRAWQAGG
ncbi:DUF2585 family protein [Sphingomonas ginkgonis]|uniref:DUF2585 family protein n=1 Tax=Sphingomonas ginkgonis TaxID=2315330 RepID=A0A3R9WMM8_9SPHN|nr:DUF2585 family protein [Sphingomonas ginkgonis]RST30024.1 DUF2585 family protein [Sphingomonas ginkgonis]